jgi:hypothetical protein
MVNITRIAAGFAALDDPGVWDNLREGRDHGMDLRRIKARSLAERGSIEWKSVR